MTGNQAQRRGFGRYGARAFEGRAWDNVRAQNGPGIAVVEHRPGPDLSASLELTEEH